VFAYPWPDEEALIEGLFEGHAREGAMLLTFHADGALRLRRLNARSDEASARREPPTHNAAGSGGHEGIVAAWAKERVRDGEP